MAKGTHLLEQGVDIHETGEYGCAEIGKDLMLFDKSNACGANSERRW